MTPQEIIVLVSELVALASTIVAIFVAVSKVVAGQKCLMRSEMLRIYYHNRDEKAIRQFEYENFNLLYEAYKKLKGNSFIDKCKREVDAWTVNS